MRDSGRGSADPDGGGQYPGDVAVSTSHVQPLDRDSSTPLWLQLERELRRRLDLGHFPDRFPTDHELTATYDVSRHTVREALRAFNQAGVLRRVRGRGTTVALERAPAFGALHGLIRAAYDEHGHADCKVLTLERVREPRAAARLSLPSDALLVHLMRLRRPGGMPFAIERVWLPLHLGEPLLSADFTTAALYDELTTRCGVTIDGGWETIGAVAPSDDDRVELDLPNGTPVLRIERFGRADRVPIEWTEMLMRPDQFALRTDWSRRDASPFRVVPLAD
jgi:GntR family transcriptional regulator